MSKLVISAIGPASSVQDGGRYGAQRYGLTPSGAMDRLALAAANSLVGNAPFAAAIEIGPFGAAFTARDGAVRVALAGAPRNADIAGRAGRVRYVDDAWRTARRLTLGFARGGSFSYLAIEGGIQGEPMFGSLAVNARAGLGSPYPRPLQAGDELQAAAASGAAERRIDLPAAGGRADPRGAGSAGRRVRRRHKQLFLDSEWKISATSDRMGYRLEGPVDQASARPQHRLRRHRERQHPGARQRPADRADAGPRHQRRLSQDRNRDHRPISAGSRRSRPDAAFDSRRSAWPRRRPRRANSPSCCAPCPTALRAIENFDLNIEALQDANVAGAAVSAIDAGTWQIHRRCAARD